MADPTASVIVCTYNAERQLELTLTALVRQVHAPLEILIADDGSGPATAALIERMQDVATMSIRHVWHDDDGVRKAVIVNAAVAQAAGDQVVFIDGDCIPHRNWLADHLRAAQTDPDAVWCGRRHRLGPDATEAITPDDVAAGVLDSPWSSMVRRAGNNSWGNALRLPWWLARILNRKSKGLMGCNFSMPRTLYEAVNGYEEDWPGMVLLCEDWDLECRLRAHGARLRMILNAGVVHHLHHTERPVGPEVQALRVERLQAAPWARHGVAEHRSA